MSRPFRDLKSRVGLKFSGWLLVTFQVVLLAGCSGTTEKRPSSDVNLVHTAEAGSSGIGGTGRTASQPSFIAWQQPQQHPQPLEGGFGGTGHTSGGFGGTGIIGTLEGFGSIWVNGIEIGVGEETRIHNNLPGRQALMDASDLRIGQQLWLETQPDDSRTTTADIHVYYPLGGQVESVVQLEHAYEIVINGQRIYVDRETNVLLADGLKAGIYVRVSGFPVYSEQSVRRQNAWRATLIESQREPHQWLQPQPRAHFSEKVSRIVMQPNWLKSYRSGEFTQLKAGLSHPNKIHLQDLRPAEPVTALPLEPASITSRSALNPRELQ